MVFHMDKYLCAAFDEAKKGLSEGGIPIGSVLEMEGSIIGSGRNRRVQKGSVIRHAEMDCLEDAGRLSAKEYRLCTLYSTLSPCDMCLGAILLYGIPRVVVGENINFRGSEEYAASRGLDMKVVNDPACISLMKDFIRNNPGLWNEDIGR